MASRQLRDKSEPPVGNWPVNVSDARDGMFSRSVYDTGDVRDGHRLYREEGHLCVEHPDECCQPDAMGTTDGGVFRFVSHNCPWRWGAEETGQPLDELYVDGEDKVPEIGEDPVEVAWSFRSWQSWTDYGWEGDASFAWWLP